MAFFNPFGWSEEDRLAIRSIVRPITQVAALAGSMGVTFAGKGATDTVAGTTDKAAGDIFNPEAPSVINTPTPNLPTTPDPNQFGQAGAGLTEAQTNAMDGSFTADQTNIGDPYTTDVPGMDMSVARAQHLLETTEPGTSLGNLQSIGEDIEAIGGDTIDSVWNDRGIADPENLNRDGSFEPIASEQPIAEKTQLRSIEDIKTPGPDEFDDPDGWMGPTDTSNIPPNPEQAKYDQNPAEATASTAQDQAAAVQPTDPNNTPQSNEQVGADKTTPEDTRGRGGKDESKFWDLHDFSWDNLMKWLETKEGREFFFEWGQKFTAMSGGDAPNRKKLTKKQAAAIRKKVKEKYGR